LSLVRVLVHPDRGDADHVALVRFRVGHHDEDRTDPHLAVRTDIFVAFFGRDRDLV